nr:immunoglobulin light chain junction region [Macaca mulatta]MOW17491.1 immunoglobulin light chain junction region [Macaca mulatta]MOW17684.1 immunoglobulin light chain junction region [Macaca mulatta]MOW18096.1 immunoglobulin light chain junction region [Macaca mulatta]
DYYCQVWDSSNRVF